MALKPTGIAVLCLATYMGFVCNSEIIGMAAFPHGGIAIDPTEFDGNETQKEEAWLIHDACTSVGE